MGSYSSQREEFHHTVLFLAARGTPPWGPVPRGARWSTTRRYSPRSEEFQLCRHSASVLGVPRLGQKSVSDGNVSTMAGGVATEESKVPTKPT